MTLVAGSLTDAAVVVSAGLDELAESLPVNCGVVCQNVANCRRAIDESHIALRVDTLAPETEIYLNF